MSLEDIPEIVLLANENLLESISDITKEKYFRGKFIVLEPERRKPILVAGFNCDQHLRVLTNFQRWVERVHRITHDDCYDLFGKPTGGGYLFILSSKIELSQESKDFGKYNPEIVRPIIERYRDSKLLGLDIILE